MDIKRFVLLLVLSITASVVHASPAIKTWVLANGARVYFVAAHELPMVQMRVVFDAGSARDPVEKEGTALLTAALLSEGTDKLDADAVAAEFERFGAEFGGSADRDMATVSLRSLVDPTLLDPAVALMARLIAAPSFPAASLTRERERLLVSLQRETQDPGATIERRFYASLYGSHPYAAPPSGSLASVKAITRDDLKVHHDRFYTGANAVIAIVGDLKPSAAKELAERVVGKLPKGEVAPALPAPAPLVAARLEDIPFDSTQTHIRIGQLGMARHDPDYFPLYVGNYILGGGGLVSRLSVQVREERGLSYSVYSYFAPMREPGPFTVGLQTARAQQARALTVVRKVLSDFVAKGPTEEEMQAAKKHLTGGFPLRIDSNKKIAEYLAVIGFYRLPLDYLDNFIARIDAVTIDQVRDAFKRRLHPDRMLTVVVGGGGP